MRGLVSKSKSGNLLYCMYLLSKIKSFSPQNFQTGVPFPEPALDEPDASDSVCFLGESESMLELMLCVWWFLWSDTWASPSCGTVAPWRYCRDEVAQLKTSSRKLLPKSAKAKRVKKDFRSFSELFSLVYDSLSMYVYVCLCICRICNGFHGFSWAYVRLPSSALSVAFMYFCNRFHVIALNELLHGIKSHLTSTKRNPWHIVAPGSQGRFLVRRVSDLLNIPSCNGFNSAVWGRQSILMCSHRMIYRWTLWQNHSLVLLT